MTILQQFIFNERLYGTVILKEMRNYDTFNEKTNHMNTSINRSFMNEDFMTIQFSKEKTILRHFLSTKINRPKTNFRL